MISTETKENCCGCGACECICPTDAIEMKSDEEGFLYPFIDRKLCIGCNKCDSICPCIVKTKFDADLKLAYAGRTRYEDVLMNSTSGGIAYELAFHTVNSGGFAIGACFDSEFKVMHRVIDTVDELHRTQGSKYVQSDTCGVFLEVKKLLDQKQKVFFSGTPCQVEGLLCYLGKEYENLITQDLICHGVPSPGLWKNYIKEEGFDKADSILFRDKSEGWELNSGLKVTVGNKVVYRKKIFFDPFTYFFDWNYMLRPICYNCPFKTGIKRSDFTVADLWGLSKIIPNYISDDKGMSLLLVHSHRGKKYLDECLNRLELQRVNFDTAINQNLAYYVSMRKPPQREQFMREIWQKSWEEMYKQYVPKDPLILSIKKKLYPIKQTIMKIVKKQN